MSANRPTECLYPHTKPRSGYSMGCRCPRCTEGNAAYFVAYRAAHPERIARYRRTWATQNRDRLRTNARARRARRRTEEQP